MHWPAHPASSWTYISVPSFRETRDRYEKEIVWRVDHAPSDLLYDAAYNVWQEWISFESARLRAEENGHDPGLEPFHPALENQLPIKGYSCLCIGRYSAYYRLEPGPHPIAVAVLLYSDFERPRILSEALAAVPLRR